MRRLPTSGISVPWPTQTAKLRYRSATWIQTVIGNPAHDLVRLALSLATAARGSDLPGITVVKMMEVMVDGYEKGAHRS